MLYTFANRLFNGRFSPISSPIRVILIVAAAIFVAAAAGILSRPAGFLAAFWPANPLLAGILVRFGGKSRFPVLIGALVGYQAAGFAFGDDPWPSLQMTAGNIISATTFAFVFSALESAEAPLSSPRSVFSLLGSAAIAAAAAGVVGGTAVSGLFGQSYFDGWSTWFAAELMNYLVLLSALLTIAWPLNTSVRTPHGGGVGQSAMIPVAVLAVSFLLSGLVHHPVAIVFPVPALVWCALVLPLPPTCILVLCYSVLAMIGIKFNPGLSGDLDDQGIVIVHFGVALIALGPVLVAAANNERRLQLAQLQQAALYDDLTGALNRHAFMRTGSAVLSDMQARGKPIAVCLLDADHFKQVNDTHGHAAGDKALVALAAAIQSAIRHGDLFGRLGGEEFALVLPNASLSEARSVAERIRTKVADLRIGVEPGVTLTLTVSVGVAAVGSAETGLAEVLSLADGAMYDAKRAGRNRVQLHGAAG